jgi:hypothetical protein
MEAQAASFTAYIVHRGASAHIAEHSFDGTKISESTISAFDASDKQWWRVAEFDF